MASHNPGVTLASTLQSASLNRHPSPLHDINPSTSASTKEPVTVRPSSSTTTSSTPEYALQPARRNSTYPPLPDLRFEQSYLKSIHGREGWGVAWITLRDQVVLPLCQGLLWTLVLAGWRTWNAGARFKGVGIGARVRRWWWGVNSWKIPDDMSARRKKLVREAGDYFSQ